MKILDSHEDDGIFEYWKSDNPLIKKLINQINEILEIDITLEQKESQEQTDLECWILSILITKAIPTYSFFRPNPHLSKWPTLPCVTNFITLYSGSVNRHT